MAEHNQKKRKRLIILCVVLGVLLLHLALFAVIYGIYDHYYDKMQYVGSESTVDPNQAGSIIESILQSEENDPDQGTTAPVDDPIYNPNDVIIDPGDVGEAEHGKHVVNILLVGQDARPGQPRQRSDSMILLTFNNKTREITLTSFMRDQYVNIPGYGSTKLCHAYQYGGMALLNETIKNHFGVTIHGNFEVDFDGFREIIDYLGGVEIELTSAEAEYLHTKGYKHLTAGKNILKGEEALWYARLRSIDTDYNRAERQRKVISSVINAYKDQDLAGMLELLETILPKLKTNMTKSDILKYATRLFPMVAGAEVNTMRIPLEGTYSGGFIKVWEGMELWCQLNIDFAANQAALQEIFAEE
jgi:LCP family protein required for cell wall assembly